jgi:hypothetical protein
MGYAAAASLLVSGATAGLSFYQSSQQKKLQREAEAEAKVAMDEAKRKLDVNFYESLGIQKEPYELEREAMLSNMANTIYAGVESRRGVVEVANAVNMANNVGQREIAGAMGKDMYNLNKVVADEEVSLNQAKTNIDLGTARGAQLAAQNREQLATQSFMQGMEGVTSIAGTIASIPALYGTDPENLKTWEANYNKSVESGLLDQSIYTDDMGGMVTFSEAARKSGMSLEEFSKYIARQSSKK